MIREQAAGDVEEITKIVDEAVNMRAFIVKPGREVIEDDSAAATEAVIMRLCVSRQRNRADHSISSCPCSFSHWRALR